MESGADAAKMHGRQPSILEWASFDAHHSCVATWDDSSAEELNFGRRRK
jgi:hypothetical protein